MQKVSIIVLNWNGWKDTIECLKSIEKLEIGNWKLEIVVVDNGSSENYQLPITNYQLIKNKTNLGFAQGNNVGIRDALENGADYIMLLNNDTLIDKNLVNQLLKTIKNDETIGIVGPKIYFAPGFEFHKDHYQNKDRGRVIWYAGGLIDWKNVLAFHRGVDEVDNNQYDIQEETDFISGCCMMVKREVFEKIGLFDERYYLYFEDTDFSTRVKRAGFKVVYAPKATLWHKNAGSAGGSGSALQDYYTTRNRLLFGMKYAPMKSKLALVKESMKLLFFGRKWQKKGVADFYWQHFGKGSYKQ